MDIKNLKSVDELVSVVLVWYDKYAMYVTIKQLLLMCILAYDCYVFIINRTAAEQCFYLNNNNQYYIVNIDT